VVVLRSVGTPAAETLQPLRAEPVAAPPTLTLRGIEKAWGKGEARLTVLDSVDLELADGSATWVGGRNGVGKTTLLRIAAGMIHPEQGTVELLGLQPRRDRREYQRRVGFLSAGDRGLYPRLSVRRHLDLCARIALLPRGRREAAIESSLRRFELTALAARRTDRLSLGQRQRLRLALSTLHEPKLLLLDEPRNSFDAEGNALLEQVVRELLVAGGAVLWCSPEESPSSLSFDHRFELSAGRLFAS